MARFKFYLKKTRAEGETAIYLSIHSNGKRLKYYTGQSIEPKYWNQKDQKAIKVKHAPEFNGILINIKASAVDISLNLKRQLEQEPNPEQIRAELEKQFNSESDSTQKPRDFLSFFQWVTENITSRVNDKTQKPLSLKTREVFRRCLNLLKEYQRVKRKRLDFDTIDLDFYLDFKTYLEKKYNFAANTIGKHIKRIKTVLNEATERGLNKNLLYKSKRFRAVEEPTQNIYLSESELQFIEQLDLSANKRLNNVRDLFLLGCWTGLRFSDLSRLDKSHIQEGFISITTKKTGELVEIPILPMAQRIINKHTSGSDLKLPTTISNQKMNEYLKELGQMVPALKETFEKERTQAGLKVSIHKEKWELLTTHTARRSFATNMFLHGNGKIPVSVIMAITGHRTEKQFYKYIQMKPRDKAVMLKSLYAESKPLKVLKNG